MSDSEPIDKGDLGSVVSRVVDAMDVGMAIVVFLLVLFSDTTVFFDRFLSGIAGATLGTSITEKGSLIRAGIVAVVWMLIAFAREAT